MPGNKFKLSRAATQKLVYLKSRTGLTPNILSRIGFCLSLAEAEVPDPSQYPEDGMEFNRYTLLGDYDPMFLSLLKQRLTRDGLDPANDFVPYFKAHMNRGAMLVSHRVRTLSGILELLPLLRIKASRS